MKTNVYIGVAIRIIVLFVVAMLATFLPEYLEGFFGDYAHKHGEYCNSTCSRETVVSVRHAIGVRLLRSFSSFAI